MKILMLGSGDAKNRKAWSGVPNSLLREFERMGNRVICGDWSKVPWIAIPRTIFNRVVRRLVVKYRWVPFESTRMGILLNSLFLRRCLRKSSDVDIVVAFSFSVSAKYCNKPLIMIHDWTNGYMQQMYMRRDMTVTETKADERLFNAMRTASKVVVLYPRSADYIRRHIGKDTRVCFYGNPINSDRPKNLSDNVEGGCNSKRILCIGGEIYRENVNLVISAVARLKDSGIVVDVIGLSKGDIELPEVNVNYYGYLDKDKLNDYNCYMSLIKSARCLVNVRLGWGGGSSIAESLYNGLPVIVGKYPDIIGLYGQKDGVFGYYCNPGDIDDLVKCLNRIIDLPDDEYREMCMNAAEITSNDTYGNFISKLLS